MTDEPKKERPAWLDDETIIPPYPVLRCPNCKKLFSDHAIHICSKEFLHPSFSKPTGLDT